MDNSRPECKVVAADSKPNKICNQKMKKMKTQNTTKRIAILVGVVSLAFAISSQANISYNGTYTGTLSLENAYGDADSVDSSGLGTFTSFCLNSQVYANSGQTYNYVSSDTVFPGNPGGPVPNYVTLGTAWLYSQFDAGSLSGYTYGNAGSANDLQAAIWYLQGSVNGQLNSFVYAAEAAVGTNNVSNASGGQYGVFALTLTSLTGGAAQPILGMVPEPSTVVAGVLLLLPFGVSTVRILRKGKVS
jgi:hypothetical protein